MPPVLLINPNSNAATTQAMLGIAREILTDVLGWTAPTGPSMITDEGALDAASVVVGESSFPTVAGVIVSAFGDPGAEILARRLDCPVIGIGQAAALEARAHGTFAVATTTPGLKCRIDSLMQTHAGDARYVGCFLADGYPHALMGDPAILDAALLAAVQTSAAAGAKAVIIGGGPLGEAADRLAATSSVPLIAPIRSAARLMKARLKQ